MIYDRQHSVFKENLYSDNSKRAASLIGHGIVYYLLGRYPVSVTTPLMLLSPVLAVAFGVLLWGDVLTWKLVLGGVLTLAGIAVITLPAATR